MNLSNCQNLGDMVTIMSPEGKPIQVAASSLQMGGVQNSTGTYKKQKINK